VGVKLWRRLTISDICPHFRVTHTRVVPTSQLTPARDDIIVPESEIDSTCVLAESTALESYFENGLRQEVNADEVEGSDGSDSDEEPNEEGLDDREDVEVDNARTRSALAWADKFILETRRKGGRQTENSVLKLWKVCPKNPECLEDQG
jgi:hypothetical protein